MYNFVFLSVKCPVCGVSFMDEEHPVDNSPGIKLNIKSGDNRGTIYLSSIYGSYNYICDITLLNNEIVEFYCPHCNTKLISEKRCRVCKANMIPLYLDIGGTVEICSRVGCKNHLVEFDDLSLALRKFYQEYSYPDIERALFTTEEIQKVLLDNVPDESKEIIETGTFLQTYCPHCKRSLLESNMLKLKIINEKNEEGYLMLSPYLNVFSSKSTIFLQEEKIISDIKCFHCNESLIQKDKKCEICGSPVAKINLSARTKLIDFYICSKKGCKWHGLSEDDVKEIKLEDSEEW